MSGVNPKDIIGATKPDLSLIPGPALVELARSMADGAKKYGAYNWREKGKPVQFMTYAAAAQRHLQAAIDGEDKDPVSLCLHLAHAMACCGIVIDAKACDNMIDNRPLPAPTAQMIRDYTAQAAPQTVNPAVTATPAPAKKGRYWEDELETLRERVFARYTAIENPSMSTDKLAQGIHDLWREETNEITGVEPIADLLRARQLKSEYYYRDGTAMGMKWHKKPGCKA